MQRKDTIPVAETATKLSLKVRRNTMDVNFKQHLIDRQKNLLVNNRHLMSPDSKIESVSEEYDSEKDRSPVDRSAQKVAENNTLEAI